MQQAFLRSAEFQRLPKEQGFLYDCGGASCLLILGVDVEAAIVDGANEGGGRVNKGVII